MSHSILISEPWLKVTVQPRTGFEFQIGIEKNVSVHMSRILQGTCKYLRNCCLLEIQI